VRQRARVGYLTDGFASPKFVRALLDGFARAATLPFGDGELIFRAQPGFDLSPASDRPISWVSAEQTTSTLQIVPSATVKLMRRATGSIDPELEMIRFLTERGYDAIEALQGELTRKPRHGPETVIAVVQNFISNQGDGFRWTIDQLKRVLDTHAIATASEAAPFELYEIFARRIGMRLGELHRALAEPTDNSHFAPELIEDGTIQEWQDHLSRGIKDAIAVLDRESNALDSERAQQVASLKAGQESLTDAALKKLRGAEGARKTRVHGDLHLSHVLVTGGDVIITNFGGDPRKTVAERRAKTHPLRDVASMLRSFDYAAKVAEHEEHVAEGSAGEERAAVVLESFRRTAEAEFLKGYEEGIGMPLSPAGQDLLAVFALERAAQECIDAASDPNWLDVPLKGFARLAAQIMEHAS
jgi:maltose alpha-D-glucosyltransferase/alpha-amylase